MSFKIVVMSCDKNKDLFEAFHHCMEKYWPEHPEIIYSTETVVNPYYRTICTNYPIEKWTKRVYETVKDLPCRNILLMCDDIFIREKVDNKLIWSICDYVRGNTAALNFEWSFDKKDTPFNDIIMRRNPNGKYKVSCMCQMWMKRAILDLFNVEKDPWKFEKSNVAKNYKYLITKNGNFINWGRIKGYYNWGIVKGKWAKEAKEFFDKEGININYEERGFCDV